MLDRWNQLMEKGRSFAGADETYGEVRIVKKGAKPEVVLKGQSIFIDGRAVRIGASLTEWKRALKGAARCSSRPNDITLCVWDELGVQAGTGLRGKNTVLFFNLFLHVDPSPPWNQKLPDGNSMPKPTDHRPRKPFPGYLELDGFGVDAKTEFWELRAKAEPVRNLRCGLRDCSHPRGGFSDDSSLYMRLNRASDRGNIVEFSVSGTEAEPATEPK